MMVVLLVLVIALLGVAVGCAIGIHRRLGRIRHHLRARTDRLQKDLVVETVLSGSRYGDPRHLCRFEAQVYSQHGEDGVISEILRRIGAPHRSFVEIGAGDGQENNTLYRLAHGWSGHWFEADPANVRRITKTFRREVSEGRLCVVQATLTAENAAQIAQRHCVPTVFDLLSLDIDQNTSHLWRALGHLAPRLVVVEYNASIPRDDSWEVDYRPDAMWDGSLYFGASLSSLVALGESLGYVLVGCELSGSNAFFVQRDLVDDQFAGPFTPSALYEPPRYYLVGRPGHPSPYRVVRWRAIPRVVGRYFSVIGVVLRTVAMPNPEFARQLGEATLAGASRASKPQEKSHEEHCTGDRCRHGCMSSRRAPRR